MCVSMWGICVSEYVHVYGVHVHMYIRMYIHRCHDTKGGVPESSVQESALSFHVRGRDRTLIFRLGSK